MGLSLCYSCFWFLSVSVCVYLYKNNFLYCAHICLYICSYACRSIYIFPCASVFLTVLLIHKCNPIKIPKTQHFVSMIFQGGLHIIFIIYLSADLFPRLTDIHTPKIFSLLSDETKKSNMVPIAEAGNSQALVFFFLRNLFKSLIEHHNCQLIIC